MRQLFTRKRLFFALSGVILGVAIAWVWRDYQTPLSGGGSRDGFFARLAKNRAYGIIPPAQERVATRLTPENANGWFSLNAEPVQSLASYQSQNPMRPTLERRTLVLQPLGNMNAEEKTLLADSKLYCEAFFGLPTRIAPPLQLDKKQFLPRPSPFGASKIQLNCGALLQNALLPRLPRNAAAYLGLTADDLWTQGLSFVFGQATFDRRIGVYSLARYFPPKRGVKPTPQERQIALRRTVQVLSHEVGHIFGLTHCVLYKCNMNGSNSLADSDASPLSLCPVCERKLAWSLGFDPIQRKAKLRAFHTQFGLKN